MSGYVASDDPRSFLALLASETPVWFNRTGGTIVVHAGSAPK